MTKTTPKALAPSLEELEDEVGRSPGSAVAWGALGIAYAQRRQHELAATALERAVRLDTEVGAFWYWLAQTRFDLEDFPGAQAAAQRAVDLEPGRPMTWLLLARAHGAVGRLREAILYLEQAIRLEPTWPIPHADLGWARYTLQEHAAAREAFETALRLDPDMPKLWQPLGICLLCLRQPEKAVNVLETAVFNSPVDVNAWTALGSAYHQSDRNQEAAKALAHARELGHEGAWMWFWTGQTAAALGDRKGLEEAYNELKARDESLAKDLEPCLRRFEDEAREKASAENLADKVLNPDAEQACVRRVGRKPEAVSFAS